MRVPTRCGLVAMLALAPAACGRDHAATSDSQTLAAATDAASSAAPGVVGADCPRTGHWTPCQVKLRLSQSGLAPRDSVLEDLPSLGPPPKVYVLGTNGLAVYLFPDSTTRHRAAATLDSTKFIAASSSLTMRHEATAVQNDNLLAILFSQREQQRERVSDALRAGAPQP